MSTARGGDQATISVLVAVEPSVAFAPGPSGTLVTVQHRGWSGIRPDHPARHGDDVPAFLRSMGMWWGDLLTSLREHAAARAAGAGFATPQ